MEGVRVRGGVGLLPEVGWKAIIHITPDDADSEDDVIEWRSKKTFSTEEQALAYYSKVMGPRLIQTLQRIEKQFDGKVQLREFD